MEELKLMLIADIDEIKDILVKHCFYIDYQTKQECYDTTKLEVEFLEIEKGNKIAQFIIKFVKKIDALSNPVVK